VLHDKFDNSDIQKCALEVHDAEEKLKASIPKPPEEPEEQAQEDVSISPVFFIVEIYLTQNRRSRGRQTPPLRHDSRPLQSRRVTQLGDGLWVAATLTKRFAVCGLAHAERVLRLRGL
jgi:hypothetical protein